MSDTREREVFIGWVLLERFSGKGERRNRVLRRQDSRALYDTIRDAGRLTRSIGYSTSWMIKKPFGQAYLPFYPQGNVYTHWLYQAC